MLCKQLSPQLKNLLKLNENIRLPLPQRARRSRKKTNSGNVGIRAIACGWETFLMLESQELLVCVCVCVCVGGGVVEYFFYSQTFKT